MIRKLSKAVALLCIGTAGVMSAQEVPANAPARTVTFNAEKVGGPASSFEAIVGDWYIGQADGQTGWMVDGTRWRQGTPSTSLADQAKRLYGDRYAEFLDGVKAFAFFPLAVWAEECSGDRTISVRFYPIAGRIDQAAGIANDVQKDGSYWGVRANALENNLMFFKVVKGKRTIVENIRGVETATRSWHTLEIIIEGKRLTAKLDGTERLRRTLEHAPTGRCGIWSKADSKVLFDDFSVMR
jgi:hypothetical protein